MTRYRVEITAALEYDTSDGIITNAEAAREDAMNFLAEAGPDSFDIEVTEDDSAQHLGWAAMLREGISHLEAHDLADYLEIHHRRHNCRHSRQGFCGDPSCPDCGDDGLVPIPPCDGGQVP